MGILIRDAQVVLPEYDNGRYLGSRVERTSIGILGKNIYFIGDNVPGDFKIDEEIDGRDSLVIPGLINAHTHSYMSLFRNSADDLPFMEWLMERIDPMEQKLTPEDAYIGAKLAIIEMMKSGTTCFNDMQMHIHQTTKAVAETGMRAFIGRGLVGGLNDDGSVNDIGTIKLNEALEEMEKATMIITSSKTPYSRSMYILDVLNDISVSAFMQANDEKEKEKENLKQTDVENQKEDAKSSIKYNEDDVAIGLTHGKIVINDKLDEIINEKMKHCPEELFEDEEY